MKLVVGLGNPGIEFEVSRHNIGFIVLDNFAVKKKVKFRFSKNYLCANRKLYMLLKPMTFMNLSGKAIVDLSKNVDDMLVICDDIYLPFGEIRLRNSGSDGGHNGLKSIIEELNDDRFYRMRIGVGKPDVNSRLEDYVLENFYSNEMEKLNITTDFSIKLIDCFIHTGYQSMLNFYSKHKKTYSEQIVSESTDHRRNV
jgi:PTH1 family peptidyl-tRNA hydrolase